MGEESRPDVALFAPDTRLVGFVEAKFWAVLTASQPVEYLRELEGATAPSVLVFLAPEKRLASLRAEVVERCRRAASGAASEGRYGRRVVGHDRVGTAAVCLIRASTPREALGSAMGLSPGAENQGGRCGRRRRAAAGGL